MVKGAAWAVPAVSVAMAAPALAASGESHQPSPLGNSFLTIAAANVNTPGINDPVYDYESIEAAGAGLPSTFWSSESSNPTRNWNTNGCQTAQNFARGVGVYTPHGTKGSGNGVAAGQEGNSAVDGTGIWIGSPVDESGNPVSGTTILSAGTMIVLSLDAVMNSEEIARSWNGEVKKQFANGKQAFLYGPRIQGSYKVIDGRDGTRGVAVSQSWGVANGDNLLRTKKASAVSNGWRVAETGVSMARDWAWDRDGVNLHGSITHTLNSDLRVSYDARTGHQRFNQVLVNSNSLWEAPLDSEVVEMTWTLKVVSGTVTSGATALSAASVFPQRQIRISHQSNPQATC